MYFDFEVIELIGCYWYLLVRTLDFFAGVQAPVCVQLHGPCSFPSGQGPSNVSRGTRRSHRQDADRMRIVESNDVAACGDAYSSVATLKVQGPDEETDVNGARSL